jgi:hypothetical protein
MIDYYESGCFFTAVKTVENSAFCCLTVMNNKSPMFYSGQFYEGDHDL